MMKESLRSVMWKYMLTVVAVTAMIRLGVWVGYEAYLMSSQKDVLHQEVTELRQLEEFNELLLLILIEGCALLVLVFMLWKFSKRILSPIRSIANAAHMISGGKLDKRIRTEHLPSGELLDIANLLNQAFDRYQQAMERIAQFTSAASHQLRTPLTAMQTTAELCLQKNRTREEYVETISSMLEEMQRLSHMSEQLLALSRIESEQNHNEFEPVDLGRAIRQALEYYEPVIESRGIRISEDLPGGIKVWARPPLLTEIITNLLDNAIKVCGEGDVISLSAKTLTKGEVSFRISDSGPGVPELYKDQIFERFARCPATPYQGSGLGLSIVSEIVRLHHGRITLEKSDSGGAAFCVTLKDANAPAGDRPA